MWPGKLIGTLCGALALVDVVHIVHCDSHSLGGFPDQAALVRRAVDLYAARFPDIFAAAKPYSATPPASTSGFPSIHDQRVASVAAKMFVKRAASRSTARGTSVPSATPSAGTPGGLPTIYDERVQVHAVRCPEGRAYLLAWRALGKFVELAQRGVERAPLVLYSEADQVLHEGARGAFAAAARAVLADASGATYVSPQRLNQMLPHPRSPGVWLRDDGQTPRERGPEMAFLGYRWTVANPLGCDPSHGPPLEPPGGARPFAQSPAWLGVCGSADNCTAAAAAAR